MVEGGGRVIPLAVTPPPTFHGWLPAFPPTPRTRTPARSGIAYRDIRTRLARINAYLQERITGVFPVIEFLTSSESCSWRARDALV